MFEGETAKGALLVSVVNALDEEKKKQLEQKLGKLDFLQFKDYPHETYDQLLEKAASLLSPDKAEGMRRLGKKVYDAVKDTLTARTLIIVLGLRTFEDVLTKGLPAAYEKLTSYSRVTVEKTGEKEYTLKIKDTGFLKSPHIADYHRGILEGIAEAYGVEIEGRILGIEKDTATIQLIIKS